MAEVNDNEGEVHEEEEERVSHELIVLTPREEVQNSEHWQRCPDHVATHHWGMLQDSKRFRWTVYRGRRRRW